MNTLSQSSCSLGSHPAAAGRLRLPLGPSQFVSHDEMTLTAMGFWVALGSVVSKGLKGRETCGGSAALG